ncbi:hypothetical protein IM697_23735 [Streptomyces ferrugineus]|uniref:Uncharacterized protein n=1 Tax=Streptomyces ferrugineus TaxID=1413221 RepID=A0A7M2SAD5_9ACTN|nr:hypothetical protein [Streptomyces ferrugineus]QOV33256.1 hypothetical protein IM697_23735 [Streptomyces ferrugineus]
MKTHAQAGADPAALHRGRLEAFVVRARRVEAHSLAADWDALVALSSAPYVVTALGNGEVQVRQEYPAEEVVESAAARVRPLLLEGDACSYLKALAAVGYFCRELPHDTMWVKAARAEWRTRAEPNAAREGGYQVMLGDAAEGWTTDLDDRKLAMAWIYGDVVHHDTGLLEEADPFGLAERFRAAVPLIAWVMVKAIELLNYVRALQSAGLLGLQAALFDREVVLTSTCWEHTVRAYTAPVGTLAPADALAPLSDEWIPLSGSAVLRHADD